MNVMGILHVVNTQFEWECSTATHIDLKKSFLIHPNHVQYQFLAFLYGKPEDYVLLTHEPEPTYWDQLKKIRPDHPKPTYIDDLQPDITYIESWGASRLIDTWATLHDLTYVHPDESVVSEVGSKEFSFVHSPQLPDSALIKNAQELQRWGEDSTFPKVLKTSFGAAGRGHQILQCKTALHCSKTIDFCDKEWSAGRPIIGEPWVDRLCDFSTQWMISKSQIHYLGCTKMECDHRGMYRGTQLITHALPEAQYQQEVAYPILKIMQNMGFFGQVGIDGFIYDQTILHPINEINPRKTMGWLAMQLGKPISSVPAKKSRHPLLPFYVQGLAPFKLQLDLSEIVRV